MRRRKVPPAGPPAPDTTIPAGDWKPVGSATHKPIIRGLKADPPGD